MSVVAKRSGTEMETYTGRYVDLMDPRPETISLTDIAVGLSYACRFGNQVSRFYSVAEHSVRCAEFTTETSRNYTLGLLLHDAHEAYTNDITSPMKMALELLAPGALRTIQDRLDVAIAEKFDFDPVYFKCVGCKTIDDHMLYREAAGLKYSHGIGEHWGNSTYYEPLVDYGWTSAEAERRFIETYERLNNG